MNKVKSPPPIRFEISSFLDKFKLEINKSEEQIHQFLLDSHVIITRINREFKNKDAFKLSMQLNSYVADATKVDPSQLLDDIVKFFQKIVSNKNPVTDVNDSVRERVFAASQEVKIDYKEFSRFVWGAKNYFSRIELAYDSMAAWLSWKIPQDSQEKYKYIEDLKRELEEHMKGSQKFANSEFAFRVDTIKSLFNIFSYKQIELIAPFKIKRNFNREYNNIVESSSAHNRVIYFLLEKELSSNFAEKFDFLLQDIERTFNKVPQFKSIFPEYKQILLNFIKNRNIENNNPNLMNL